LDIGVVGGIKGNIEGFRREIKVS